MRPDPDELLRLMRKSLKTVVTPAVSEEWPTYVAKSIERMLEHLERRWEHEIRFLADDTEEMRELFAKLKVELAGAGGPAADAVQEVVGELDQLLDEPSLASRAVVYDDLSAENQAHRAALEKLVLALDDAQGEERAEASRVPIRAYLKRQLARDVELAEPTFMRFGAPTPK
ncbi:MAG: hypothetical protein AB7L84_13180 [Acidimicrobiia bacterium]